MKKVIFLIIVLFNVIFVEGQELNLTNSLSDVVYVNPAFTGSRELLRVSLNNQLRWITPLHKTIYNSLTADLGIDRLGFGFTMQYNTLSAGFISSYVGTSFSYRIGDKQKFLFIPGIRISSQLYSLNPDDLVFYDQLSVYEGLTDRETNAQIDNKKVAVTDASVGFLLQFPLEIHRPKPAFVNFGFAYDHIPKSNFSFLSNTTLQYPSKLTVHGGVLLPFYTRDPETHLHRTMGFLMYPNFRYTQQDMFSLINAGLLFYKKRLTFGVATQTFKYPSIRNKNQLIGTIGYEFYIGKKILINAMYNIDLGFSLPNTPFFTTHEITINLFYITKRKSDCTENLKYNKKRWFNPNEIQQRHQGECPPGTTPFRTQKDISPAFYPILLPKAYIDFKQ